MSIIGQAQLSDKHKVSPKKTFDFIQNNPGPRGYIREAKFFTRKRSLGFPIVVSTILNLFKESVEYNISTRLLILIKSLLRVRQFPLPAIK